MSQIHEIIFASLSLNFVLSGILCCVLYFFLYLREERMKDFVKTSKIAETMVKKAWKRQDGTIGFCLEFLQYHKDPHAQYYLDQAWDYFEREGFEDMRSEIGEGLDASIFAKAKEEVGFPHRPIAQRMDGTTIFPKGYKPLSEPIHLQ